MQASCPKVFVELAMVPAIRVLVLCGCLFAIGCSSIPARTDTEREVLVVESRPGATPPPSQVEAKPPPPLTQPPPPQPVAVVVEKKLSAYRDLTKSLVTRMDRPYELYEFEASSTNVLMDDLRALEPASVIAIGQSALRVATKLKGIDVIYAQVFNPPETHRGVMPIPPFDMQLAYWQGISPGMERIGVLGSAAMRQVIDSLESAAESKNIEVIRREVTSDKETLQVFRAMVPHIDGFVFLPDETVLSPDVIRRIILHGSRNNLQILVYSPLMFELGAYLYISAEHDDVVEQIITLLDDPEVHTRALTTMRTRVQRKALPDDPG